VTFVAVVRLIESEAGYHATVEVGGERVGIGEPTATIGAALECARAIIVARRDRIRIGDPEVP
jgi:hypothetical protein